MSKVTLGIKRVLVGAVAGVVGLVALASPSRAALVLPQTQCLTYMWEHSAVVLDGTVESVEVTTQTGDNGQSIPATVYTLVVNRVFKGDGIGDTFSFSQFGMHSPNPEGGLYIPEIQTRYEEGKRYLLFLRGESQLGLTSPVGLEAGRFSVIEGADGSITIQNGVGNDRLLSCDVPTDTRAGAQAVRAARGQGGAISYDTMAQILNDF